MKTYETFYAMLDKPFFAPPGWVFGLAWGIIYPLIAAAFVWLLYLMYKKRIPSYFLWLLSLNMLLNFSFTPIQLRLDPLWPASIVILLVLGTLAIFQYKIFRYSKLIFALLLPYLLWGTFATILQLTLTLTN